MPRPLAQEFGRHEVQTVQSMGWDGTENGELLRLAAEAGFDALITVDKGFEYQHNLKRLPLTVAIMQATSNRIEDLQPLIPALVLQIAEIEPCTLIKVGA